MEKQKQAYIYTIIVVLLWSTVASAFKISLRYLDFLQLQFYASIVSVIVLFMILLIQNKIGLLKKCKKRDYLYSALLGFLNPCLYYVILFKAYSLVPAQEAVPLNYTWPIWVVLLSAILLKQKITFKNIVAISISYIGVFIIATRANINGFVFTNLKGEVLALGSAIVWALFWLYNVKDKRDEVVKLFLNFAFGFIFILIFNLGYSKINSPDVFGFLGATYIWVI